MAVPHVAGAAALYLEQHPHATPADVAEALYSSATQGTLQDSRMRDGTMNRMLHTLPLVRGSGQGESAAAAPAIG